jgi:hypothetical protein
MNNESYLSLRELDGVGHKICMKVNEDPAFEVDRLCLNAPQRTRTRSPYSDLLGNACGNPEGVLSLSRKMGLPRR